MTDVIKPLYTAHGTSTGGRNGHTQSDDGMVSVNLSVPKEMGGPGKPDTATPEHLFAAGYAACFGGALDFIAKQHKKDATRPLSNARSASARAKRADWSRGRPRRDRREPAAGGTAIARRGSAREDLPLQPRDARQRRRQGGHPRRVAFGVKARAPPLARRPRPRNAAAGSREWGAAETPAPI